MDPALRRGPAEFTLDVLPDLFPRSSWNGVRGQLSEPLLEDFSVPVRDRNLLRGCSNTTPERLNVRDLVVDGKIVETWRWVRNELAHEAVSLMA